MRRQTKKIVLNIATGIAVAATAAVIMLPATAFAAPGTITSNVNVRSGAGTGFAVVDVARSGERVDVQQCRSGFCYIVRPGPDGWVSQRYINSGTVVGEVSPNPGIGVGITVGPQGPSFSIGVGNQQPPVVRPDYAGEVCFFDRTRFRGDSFCLSEGDSRGRLRDFDSRVASIDNPDGLAVTVCTQPNFRGQCRTYTSSASSVGEFNGYIASISVR